MVDKTNKEMVRKLKNTMACSACRCEPKPVMSLASVSPTVVLPNMLFVESKLAISAYSLMLSEPRKQPTRQICAPIARVSMSSRLYGLK